MKLVLSRVGVDTVDFSNVIFGIIFSISFILLPLLWIDECFIGILKERKFAIFLLLIGLLLYFFQFLTIGLFNLFR